MATPTIAVTRPASVPDARPWYQVARDTYAPAFPPAWAVDVATGTLWDAAGASRGDVLHVGALGEGPRFFITVGPGVVRFSRANLARQERCAERYADGRHHVVDQSAGVERALDAAVAKVLAGRLGDGQAGDDAARIDPLDRAASRQRITGWSPASRTNMTWRLLTLDYAPLTGAALPALVTLTLPADWTRMAPTGAAFKRLWRSFGKRYARAWGAELVGIWKLEFQRRGAPHLHVLMAPPLGSPVCGKRGRCGRTRARHCDVTACRSTWREWFARTWADVAGADTRTPIGPAPAKLGAAFYVSEFDRMVEVHRHPKAAADYAEGLRATDPKRIAVYFLKHNTAGPNDKEYQHIVPAEWRGEGDGPGRFWGVLGLVVNVSTVQVSYQQAVAAARVARKIAAARITRDPATGEARGGVRVVRHSSGVGPNGQVRTRPVRRRVRRLRGTWGFLAVNDGPGLALTLSAAFDGLAWAGADVAVGVGSDRWRCNETPDERESLHVAIGAKGHADSHWEGPIDPASDWS